MSHPTFETAGAAAGIEIWTIENFEPVPVDSKMYGMFYNGDTYIVLKTSGEGSSSLRYDAHFWLGCAASQDKAGAAALWTVALDAALGGRAVHHREVQAHETALFLHYFKPAIRYLEGGNESGFSAVETNAGAERRLLRLTGCHNMRIEEVSADASSLTADHCFILEVDHVILVLVAPGAKAAQRRKIIAVANTLRDEGHNGRATVEIIDEFSSDDDFAMFFEALGSGSRDELATENSTESYTREDISAVYLYRVQFGDDIDLVSLSKPYKQSHLSTDEVYVLDTPDAGVFVWVGAGVGAELRDNYCGTAGQYLQLKGYPDWVSVTRVSEGSESAAFRQYFHQWETSAAATLDVASDIDAGYCSGDLAEASVAKRVGKSACARGYMPAGDGTLSIIRISGEQEDITESVTAGVPLIYQSEMYIVKYQYTADGGDAHVIYYWTGADATAADKQTALQLVAEMEDELGQRVIIVSVPQGRETRHFLSLFKGSLAILFGDKADGYQPQNANGAYQEDSIRLFRVEGTQVGEDTRATQVPERADQLQDDAVFVLEAADTVYVWTGKEAEPEELEAAEEFVQQVVGDQRRVVTLQQGEEPDEFWRSLRGAPDQKDDPPAWQVSAHRRVTSPRTLTAVTVTLTGRVSFEELDTEFTQQDLSDDGVYILDTGDELYLWTGAHAPERARAARAHVVTEYLSDDGLGRATDSAVVAAMRQGGEPPVFKRMFPDWDDHMWDNQTSYEDIKNETKALNS